MKGMNKYNDEMLSVLTVRIQSFGSTVLIGTGIIYNHPSLKDKVYVITAAHNLFSDPDSFTGQRGKIELHIYDPVQDTYIPIEHVLDYGLVSPDIDNDLTVLVLDKSQIERITGTLPIVFAIRERQTLTDFSVKGFTNATQGRELVTINPLWNQAMTGVTKFQLQLTEDYSGWAIEGFSGSGVFLNANGHVYLFGIFTRFREESKGKIIYCQYLESINALLARKFLPPISFSFFSDFGLTLDFFNTHIATAIANLGSRFTEELNFKLPIAFLFNEVTKDERFKHRLLSTIDNWLVARRASYYSGENAVLDEIDKELVALRSSMNTWLQQIDWDADQKIDSSAILDKLATFDEKVDKKRTELYELRWEEEKKNIGIKKDHSYRPPYENEINRLRDLQENNQHFLDAIQEINIHLANYPFLLINGEAGSGKSHLLGDVANERKKAGLPTILLLGQLFRSGQTVWQNILGQLGLSCSKDELLVSLNSIGQQLGSRMLILIDALNEGAGKDLWHNELAGLITEIKKYPFVGLVQSIRSTYYNAVIPPLVQSDADVTKVTHEGFKGNEYEALRLFCEHYGLQQPNLPILTPEFSNPLFLQLICQGIKFSGKTTFPSGFHGITTAFDFYLKAVNDKLTHKRDEYRLRSGLIMQAIEEVAAASLKQKGLLPLDKAVALFDKQYPRHIHLLDDLIHENIFIQALVPDYGTGLEQEIIHFSYERFGDFIVAKKMLNSFKTRKSVKDAFKKNKPLGKLLKEGAWSNRGILEAMAILLPEKFKLEIFEVYDWVFGVRHRDLILNIGDFLNQYLLDSLKWRNPSDIDNKKITTWINGDKCNLRREEFYNTIIELTNIPDHPFNADRFFLNLEQYTMAGRDSFLQQFYRFYTGKDDQGNAYPLQRLIDWAWQPGISPRLDKDTARLTGQTLAWVLSSTDRTLRDQTTKALVNLLEDQPAALIAILKKFLRADDLYILERLYAVAYGCTLRTTSANGARQIAQHVYDSVFSKKKPPVHILLRDYARNTVEYGLYLQVGINAKPSLFRPPYGSKMPENIPTEAEIKKFDKDHTEPGYKEHYGFYFNQIRYSVMDWDFGRYTIDGDLHDFHPVSFKMAKEYPVFLKKLPSKKRILVVAYERMVETKYLLTRKKDSLISNNGKDWYDENIAQTEEYLTKIQGHIKESLTTVQNKFFISSVVPHLKNVYRSKDWQRNSFDTRPLKRWIVQRAFDLGYDADLHGPFESSIESYNHRTGNKIERIGKKYQWIALHQILALVADNHKIKEYSGSDKYDYYRGAWQEFIRDIDPVFTTKRKKNDSEDEADVLTLDWKMDINYNYWNIPESQWYQSLDDLPDPKHIIERIDEEGRHWLYLRATLSWQEPKQIGKEKYKSRRKDLWYLLQAYIYRTRDRKKVVDWFNRQDFKGRWMPESHKANLSLLNRENYWSPASKDNEKEEWGKLKKADFRIMVATSEAVGELSQDKSGAHFGYDMPCKLLFEGMGLIYASKDGDLKNSLGELVATTTPDGGVLVSKDHLLSFLKSKQLGIVWGLLGEKRTLGNNDRSLYNAYSTLNGTYYFENDRLSGNLRFSAEID